MYWSEAIWTGLHHTASQFKHLKFITVSGLPCSDVAKVPCEDSSREEKVRYGAEGGPSSIPQRGMLTSKTVVVQRYVKPAWKTRNRPVVAEDILYRGQREESWSQVETEAAAQRQELCPSAWSTGTAL